MILILLLFVGGICFNISPYVSFVFTFQPGTYGDATGGHVRRTATARFIRQLNWIAEHAHRSNLKIEVVVTIWPSLKGDLMRTDDLTSSMRDLNLSLPTNLQTLRLIHVTHEAIKAEMPDVPKGLHVLEYVGKNIASRRAHGEVLILGGSDCMPHEAFFDWIALKLVKKNSVYGMHRCMLEEDLTSNVDDIRETVRQRESIAKRKKLIINNGMERDSFIAEPNTTTQFSEMWTYNAAGDFTMITRSDFLDMRGYVEAPFRAHVDTLFLYQCHAAKMKVYVFDVPIVCFHQNHDRGDSIIADYPIDTVDNAKSFQPLIDRGLFVPVNRNHNWGLMNYHLQSEIYKNGKKII